MSEVMKSYNEVMSETEKSSCERINIINRRNNNIIPRRYHMTELDMEKKRIAFNESVKDISADIKKLAGDRFFNPFRGSGIYFGCVQSLYLLGSNSWHEQVIVINKIAEVMSKVIDKKTGKSSWQKFCSKLPREKGGQTALTAKDEQGKIEQNYRVIQRLGGLNPCGYKLSQLGSSINIRRVKDGRWYYRLNTTSIEPTFDISAYPKPKRVKREVEVINITSTESVEN